MNYYIYNNKRDVEMKRTTMIKIIEEQDLKRSIWLRGHNEKRNFWQILEFIRDNQPVRSKDLESNFGPRVYDVLEKQINAGMIEKTADGYIISNRFALILKRLADEWKEFCEG